MYVRFLSLQKEKEQNIIISVACVYLLQIMKMCTRYQNRRTQLHPTLCSGQQKNIQYAIFPVLLRTFNLDPLSIMTDVVQCVGR